jgi:phosphinothricin acetyltransferase
MSLFIRPASIDDAEAIARIYNQGIRERIATFETSERTAEDRQAWLIDHDPRYPILVAVGVRDHVVGWAATDAYRARACYAGVAEYSIYVDQEARGQGVGGVLLEALIGAAREAGLWKLLSRIFPHNTASRALAARAGFREVGIYEKHARLDGVWLDCVIVERLIPENVT